MGGDSGLAQFGGGRPAGWTQDVISGGSTYAYAYDPDGNRTSVTINAGTPTDATYDVTDQLLAEGTHGGTMTSFSYDAYGNMLQSAETFSSGITNYTYDYGDRLTKVAPPSVTAATYTLDALGRIASETVGSTTTMYSYAGTSKTVSRLATGSTNIDALLGADGSRLAVVSGSSFGWLLPDLHGDVAGASSSSLGTITDALRYDAYGDVVASVTSSLPTPWRYQGRLLVSPSGGSDLYDAGARFYAPGLGIFTQLDSTQGGALNPLTMNRYLYTEADPETLTDPSGHDGFDPFGALASLATGTFQYAAGFARGTFEGAAGVVVSTANLANAVGSCALDSACSNHAAASAVQGIRDFASDVPNNLKGLISKAAFGAADWVGHEHDTLSDISHPFQAGEGAGQIVGSVEASGFLAKAPAGAADLISGAADSIDAFSPAIARLGELKDEAANLAAQGGLTPAQEAASIVNPTVRRMFEGERVDAAFRRLVNLQKANDPAFDAQVRLTPRGQWGPDVIRPTARYPWQARWLDVTTHASWPGHLIRYWSLGPGRPLVY